MYPGGIPLQPESITYENMTLREMWLKRVDDIYTRKVPPNLDHENHLRDYVLYYIHAPLFRNEFTDELLDKDFDEISFDALVMECLDYGLDPF